MQQKIREKFPTAMVTFFTSWFDMEWAWQECPKPDAVIVDLFVPEGIAKLIKLFRMTLWGWTRFLLTPFRPLVWIFVTKLETEKWASLSRDVVPSNTPWGGLEFLRRRAQKGDQSGVRFYLYTIGANEKFLQEKDLLAKFFGPTMEEIRKLSHEVQFTVFSKGDFVIKYGYATGKIKNDSLQALLAQMALDLQAA